MVDYHPFDETIWDEPFEAHKRLRDEAPAYYLEEFDCWFLSRFADIWDVCSDQSNLTSVNGITTTHLLTHQTPNAPNLTAFDGEEHTRVRSYFTPHFKPAAARALERRAQEISNWAIDQIVEKGEGDAVADLGGALAVRVASTILGIPLEDADMIMDWVNGYFARTPGVRGATEEGTTAAKEFGLYLFQLARRARAEGAPEGSILDQLLKTEINGELADDRSIAIHLNMMAIGGTETFPKVLSAALYRLWQHQDQRSRCIEDPGLAPHAFWETLRYDMPTHMLGRTVKDEFELHGQRLMPGSSLMFLWGSANRDEREFENPNVFDIDRCAPRILSFGVGQHMCLGTHIAKMEGRTLLAEVLRRLPDYEVEESGVERIQSEFFRGFARMPIRFTPGNREGSGATPSWRAGLPG
jgi:cytochrome P450